MRIYKIESRRRLWPLYYTFWTLKIKVIIKKKKKKKNLFNFNVKNKKGKEKQILRTWWHMPVTPATQEAEAGESLEPRRWKL